MATQVASLYGLLTLDSSDWDVKLKNADSGLAGLGSKLQSIGAKMTLATAPITAGLGVSVKAAVDFDESITNVAAVLGLTGDEATALGKDLLKIGRKSRSGPQAIADAYYDIAGGVADTSSHMAILNAAVATSEAGNADLAGTTSALISIMNSYGFSADKAGFASDVLTQTVAKGVGTMDDFAGALPQVSGLANSVGISFDDLGGMMAYLTTKGNTASQSATQLGAMMTALLNPNEAMKKALGELGFTTGKAAIENLGLVGTFGALADKSPVFQSNMAGAVGSVEALRGVTAFGSDNAVDALAAFSNGLDGATEAARRIQNESFAAQFDLLKSNVSGLAITIGTALLPNLNELIGKLQPIIDGIVEWIDKNPQATQTLLILSGVLVVAGPLMTALGTAIKLVSVGLAIVTAPAFLLAAAIGAIIAAAQLGYPGGIGQLLTDAAVAAQKLAAIFMFGLTTAINWVRVNVIDPIIVRVNELIVSLQNAWDWINKVGSNVGAGVSGISGITSGLASGQFSVTDVLNATWAQITGRAVGGDVSAGQPYVVGERGPELFVPGQSGAIVPNGAMGGVSISGLTIYANDAAGGRAAADAFERRIGSLLAARGGA